MASTADRLDIPSDLTRAISRESFQSDASMLSMSVVSHGRRRVHAKDYYEAGGDADSTSQSGGLETEQCEAFERMLVCSTMPTAGRQQPPFTFTAELTDSDLDLLRKCAKTKPHCCLFKSFSTTDLVDIKRWTARNLMRTSASQALLLPNAVGAAASYRRRREHMSELQQQNGAVPQQQQNRNTKVESKTANARPKPNKSVKIAEIPKTTSNDVANTPDSVVPPPRGRACSLQHTTTGMDETSSTSGWGLPRAIGSFRKIRDDLLRKLSKKGDLEKTDLDVQRDEGRPVTRNERNFMIFHWLQSLDDDSAVNTGAQ